MYSNRKTGKEHFILDGEKQPFTVLDFWRWAWSDLLSNSLRGVLAEFIVASALGVKLQCRSEWDPFDISYNGLNLEVKSASYIQSWNQKNYSNIRFSIYPAYRWDPETNKYFYEKRRNSHFYIFCVLKEKDRKLIDPLNLSQWDFYIIMTYMVNKNVGVQKTIGLSKLQKIGAVKVKFGEIKVKIDDIFKKNRTIILNNYDYKL